MDIDQNQQAPQENTISESNGQSSSIIPPNPNSLPNDDKHTPVWLLILLFLIFQPAALFIIFKEKYYHRWLPILLWLYAIPLFLTYLILRISVIPQLDVLYKTLNVPNSLSTINLVIIFFMAVLFAEIVYGIILFRKTRLTGYLSKNLLVIAFLFFVMNFIISPAFIIVGIVGPIYHLTSSFGESTIPKTTRSRQFPPIPTINPIANWKTYTNKKFGYSLKYPQNWSLTEDYAEENGGYFTYIGSQEYKYADSSVQIYGIYIHYRNSPPSSRFGNYKQQTLNNYKIFRSVSYPQYWNDDVFFQIKDNQFIEINFSPYNLEKPYLNQNDAHKIFDQILQTFKFTDQTASWKTYNYNTKGKGFILKYPQNYTYKEWTFTDRTLTPNGSTRTIEKFLVDFEESDSDASKENRIKGWFRISFNTSPDLTNLDVEMFMNLTIDSDNSSYPYKWEDVMVGPLNARKAKHSNCLSGDCQDVLFKKDATIYDLSIPEQASNENRQQIFNQILQTFRFSD